MTYIQLGVEILWGNQLLPNALFCVPQDSTTHIHMQIHHMAQSHIRSDTFSNLLPLFVVQNLLLAHSRFTTCPKLQPLRHRPKHMRITGCPLLRQGLGGANGNHKFSHFYLAWSHDLGVSYCHS